MEAEELHEADKSEPGMAVEATRGDLGEEEVSKPKISKVVKDERGHVKDIMVRKGTIFKKKLKIPADRVQKVEDAVVMIAAAVLLFYGLATGQSK